MASKIYGACEVCGQPATTVIKWNWQYVSREAILAIPAWLINAWRKWSAPARRACSEHIGELTDKIKAEITRSEAT